MSKKLLLVGVLLFGTLLALAAQVAIEAKMIRRLPERTSFLEAVGAAEPRGAALRYLLLRPGDQIYHAAILPWLYTSPSQLKDNAWNRILLEHHALALPRDLSLEYIDDYPLTARPVLQPILVEALERGSLRSLRKLAHYEEGMLVVERWIDEALLGPGDFELFAEAFPVLVRVPGLDLTPLLDAFASRLDEEAGGYGFFSDPEELAQAIQGSPNAAPLLEWVSGAIESGKLTVAGGRALLSALLVTPEVSEATAELILGRERQFARSELAKFLLPKWCYEPEDVECEVPTTVPEAFLHEAFAGLRADTAGFLALFHALAHSGDNRLAAMAKQVLSKPDSEIRKGAIVLLARHEVSDVAFDVDQAFSGATSRPLLFSSQSQYLESRALESYEKLAGHRYDQIGKRFPPYLGGRIPERGDIAEWRRFIGSYPWFPATDDAYYRLAHVQFLYGDLLGAQGTIEGYRQGSFIDQDIEPYMDRLDLAVFLAQQGLSARDALSMVDVETLPWLFDAPEGARSLERYALAIDWLLMEARHEEISRGSLMALRRDLDRARAECTRTWFDRCEVPASAPRLVGSFEAHEAE